MNQMLLVAEINITAILVTIAIGALCGFLAGSILKGSGYGLLGNIVIGILGAFVGSFVFSMLGISIGMDWVGEIVTGTVGALVLLIVLGYVQKTVNSGSSN